MEEVAGPQYMSVSGVPMSPGLILTSVRVSRRESLAFVRTLGGAVYTYAFGELPGSMSVSGLVFFLDSCGGRWGDFARASSQYSARRAYAGDMAFVGIGGAGFRCVLSGADFGAEASETPMGSFSMNFTVIPSGGRG